MLGRIVGSKLRSLFQYHGDRHGYGYGYGEEEHQSLSVAVDCEAQEDGVLVKVFDESRGEGNAIRFAYVEVKTCSFGPQSH